MGNEAEETSRYRRQKQRAANTRRYTCTGVTTCRHDQVSATKYYHELPTTILTSLMISNFDTSFTILLSS